MTTLLFHIVFAWICLPPVTMFYTGHCCSMFTNYPDQRHIMKRHVPECLAAPNTTAFDMLVNGIAQCAELCFQHRQWNSTFDDSTMNGTTIDKFEWFGIRSAVDALIFAHKLWMLKFQMWHFRYSTITCSFNGAERGTLCISSKPFIYYS